VKAGLDMAPEEPEEELVADKEAEQNV